jgi:hypothetical protein
MVDCEQDDNDGMLEFTWDMIRSFSSNASLLSNYDPLKFRTADVYSRYVREGCTLNLDFQSEWFIVPNGFPYNVTVGISHYVLFRRRDLDMPSPKAFLDDYFHGKDVRWYENPECLRSIKLVGHYHVFVRDLAVSK